MAEIDVTVDDALANDAMRVLDEIGMDMETAVRVFLKQIVADGKLPLEVSEEWETNRRASSAGKGDFSEHRRKTESPVFDSNHKF